MKARSVLPLLLAAACGGGTTAAPTTPPTAPPADTTAMPTPPPTAPPAPVDTQLPPLTSNKPVTNKSLASIGLDPTLMDKSVDPCDDFFEFACGSYVKNTVIPDDKAMAMRSFVDIGDKNLDYLHGILETAKTNPGKDKLMQRVGAFYASCLDEAGAEKRGIAPIKPLLAQIKAVKDPATLAAAVTAMHASGLRVLFDAASEQDPGDATKVIGAIGQGGLGLPEREFYLDKSDAMQKLRDAYVAYVTSALGSAGYKPDEAAARAQDVLALETEIAKSHKTRVESRDPVGTYNKIDRTGLVKAMPHFAWDKYFAALGVPKLQDIDTSTPAYLAKLDELMTTQKPEVWRAYLTAHLVASTAPLLTKEIDDAAFAFGQNFSGQKQQEPRWKRCVRSVDHNLGEDIGQIFVRDRFPGDSKKAAEEEVAAIIKAMSDNLDALPWMDAQTKAKAKEKLATINPKIGYPKKWRDYKFHVDPHDFFGNVIAARKAEVVRDWTKVGKPVDKGEFGMSAPTVNAYYNPSLNEIVFPAGILQPPFYSLDASIPVNLGGMGMVVGHELTHGFDDQGAQYDALGNLKSWWQPDTEKLFKQRTQCVIDQYSKYEISGVHLNGGATVGENIADIGGVKLALAAYRSLRASAPDTVVADGFSEDQQFFLSFGQSWCAKGRPEMEKARAQTDPHSPARWRVDGTLSATPEFSRAWSCKLGAKMRPANACVVW